MSWENGGHDDGRTLRDRVRRDRREAGRHRRRQGRTPGGTVAARRGERAARLLRDHRRVPAGRGGPAGARRVPGPALPAAPGRPRGDPDGQRRDPPRRRGGGRSGRGRGGDRCRAGRARRARRLRGAVERDGRGPADGLLRRPAGHLPERGGPGRDPHPRRPVLGVAVHRAGGDLPPTQRYRSPYGAHGRGGAADGAPGRGGDPVHRRPGQREPEGRLGGGRVRSGRGPGRRPGHPGRVHGARRPGPLPDHRHQAAGRPRRAGRRDAGPRRSIRPGGSSPR